MPITDEQYGNTMLRSVLDAMPSAVFIVDADVRVIDANQAAQELMRAGHRPSPVPLRAGEALKCVHASEHPDGCGRSADCGECVIRGAVGEALDGRTRRRLRTRMHLHLDDQPQDAYLQVTASGFDYQGRTLALLVLEDISEFAELRKIVPICSQCKKIRQDQDYWQSVEKYVGRYLDLSFSHSYCPACKQDLLRSLESVTIVPKRRQSGAAGG